MLGFSSSQRCRFSLRLVKLWSHSLTRECQVQGQCLCVRVWTKIARRGGSTLSNCLLLCKLRAAKFSQTRLWKHLHFPSLHRQIDEFLSISSRLKMKPSPWKNCYVLGYNCSLTGYVSDHVAHLLGANLMLHKYSQPIIKSFQVSKYFSHFLDKYNSNQRQINTFCINTCAQVCHLIAFIIRFRRRKEFFLPVLIEKLKINPSSLI